MFLTFHSLWLLGDVAEKEGKMLAVSKCVFGLRYCEPHGVDVTIQLEKIKKLLANCGEKSRKDIFSQLSFAVDACEC